MHVESIADKRQQELDRMTKVNNRKTKAHAANRFVKHPTVKDIVTNSPAVIAMVNNFYASVNSSVS